ncbi:MAG: DNA topoisomerase IV subunit B [Alphaproteobacteria bacterium]
MADLFQNTASSRNTSYSAKDIEVLEGLEPVRRRPGMYIGGTDESALHHLAAEVLDNAMDEAVAGHASRIDVTLLDDGSLAVTDNGRGIPIDPHPKFRDKSALEVIMTTLHSGGKFSGDAYQTSGGLHGVGISVVNALSDRLDVEVARDRKLYVQSFSRGAPTGRLRDEGAVQNRRGTTVTFHPDPEIFGEAAGFRASRLYRMARSKAYLFRGVEIRWTCDPKHLRGDDKTPPTDILHFPGGLSDFLTSTVAARPTMTPTAFTGRVAADDEGGKVEWAICWPMDQDGFVSSYCNTVPTPQGGSHEAGFRTALARSLRAYGEMTGNKKAARITAEDIIGGACAMLSVFVRNPQFQGQTKEKLSSPEAARLVEGAVKDHFDLWLANDPGAATDLLEHVLERAEDRQSRRAAKDLGRKSATRKLRLPGKLTDCTRSTSEGTEIFLVEGDSAGGSAKQARIRETQAILPLRGKILNVASATADKLAGNQELRDLLQALGCGSRGDFDVEKLRYERVIIMTDADVDGAHIAALLMTFFYRELPGLIESGHLFLALPPLYRLTQGATSLYARDDAHKDELMESGFSGRGKIEVSRFKGLGEMPPAQLRETTMDPTKRTLLQVQVPRKLDPEQAVAARDTAKFVEALMGRKPESRFNYIQQNAPFVTDLDV